MDKYCNFHYCFQKKSKPTWSYLILHAYLKLKNSQPTCLFNGTRVFDRAEYISKWKFLYPKSYSRLALWIEKSELIGKSWREIREKTDKRHELSAFIIADDRNPRFLPSYPLHHLT